jgi:LacI family gluconate utilization system Gnt-I transcriptional repressor
MSAPPSRRKLSSTRDPRATIVDVARLAGVSPITASRALRTPEKVAPTTRERIEAAVLEAGYIPDLLARSFRSRRSGIVAAIVPSIGSSQYAEMLQGVSEALRAEGLELMVGVSGYALRQEEALLQAYIGRRPEGVILSGTEHTPTSRALLVRSRIPLVEVWTLARRPVDMNVGYSEQAAVAAMVEHLVACGYRRVGFIHGPLGDNERARRRRRGFLGAARAHGLPTDRLLQLPDPAGAPFAGIRHGAEGLARMLARWADTDCVFYSSDSFAVGGLFECQRRGIAVPDQLGIAGFLGLELGAEIEPGLTTVRVPRYAIGHEAARLLIRRLHGEQAAPAVQDVGFEIVERGSTRAAAGHPRPWASTRLSPAPRAPAVDRHPPAVTGRPARDGVR